MRKRIIIDKTESVASLVERLLEVPDASLVIVVPKGARLKDSLGNFQLLKREVEAMDKELVVESVDDTTLALADAAGIEVVHPILKPTGRSLSDIVPAESVASTKPRITTKPKTEESSLDEDEDEESEKDLAHKIPIRVQGGRRASEKPFFEDKPLPEDEEEEVVLVAEKKVAVSHRPRRKGMFRVFVVAILFLLVGGGAVWGINTIWGRADITVVFRQFPWEYQSEFSISKVASKVNIGGNILPAEVFTESKNLTQLFPASGKSQVSEKASGQITIWNAYSSEAQSLVATTRFMTPDGKVFRLDNPVVVPGAEIRDGKITPASIDASVTADQPGVEYNVGPVEKLVIPGFKGSPKYDGFYGSFKSSIAGGFVGEKKTPTETDIATARTKTADVLKAALTSNTLSNRPPDFRIIEGSSEVTITRMTVGNTTDTNGNFSVFGEAKLRAIGFRDADLKGVLKMLATKDRQGLDFKSLDITYGRPEVDFEKGEARFTVGVKAILSPIFSADEFKNKVLGKPLAEAEQAVLSLQNLSKGSIGLWPRWLGSVPSDSKKVNIVIQ